MNLQDRIRQIFPAEALYCAVCQRATCAALPCPTRRSARLHGFREPKYATYGELQCGLGRRERDDLDDDKADLMPHTLTTRFSR